jgi:hypothetical protein
VSLPFGLDAWFPLIVGELQDPIVIGVDGTPNERELEAAWADCTDGQALVVVDQIQGSFIKGLLSRVGRRSQGARFEHAFAQEGRAYRWLILPSTGGSHALVPPSAAGFRAGVPILPAGRACWRVAGRMLQLAATFGCANRIGFGNLVVAVKGSYEPTPGSAWVAKRANSCVAVSLGVPGYLRKATLRVCDQRGRVEGFLKVALGAGANPRVAHEAATLEETKELEFDIPLAPRLLDSGTHGAYAWLLQSPLAGVRSPDQIDDAHVEFLSKLASSTKTTRSGDNLPTLHRSRKHLDSLTGVVDGSWLSTMNELQQALSAKLAGRDVPCSMSHGDFTPWNLSTSESGLSAFDWEFADREAPVLADLIHFHLQTGILVRRVAAPQLLAELRGVCTNGALSLLEERGLDGSDAITFIALEVLRAATDDEALNQKERPPFAQVEWLRTTRHELARLLVKAIQLETPLKETEVVAA